MTCNCMSYINSGDVDPGWVISRGFCLAPLGLQTKDWRQREGEFNTEHTKHKCWATRPFQCWHSFAHCDAAPWGTPLGTPWGTPLGTPWGTPRDEEVVHAFHFSILSRSTGCPEMERLHMKFHIVFPTENFLANRTNGFAFVAAHM